MNKIIKRTICALVSASMLASVPISALSYTGIGQVTDIYRDTVAQGLRYSQYKATDSEGNPQEAYIFEYKAKKGIIPIVKYGNKIYGMDRLGAFVNAAEAEGLRIHGAINGDFYGMQTGVPMGIMIDGGTLISSDDGKNAVGFLPDGSAIIGTPSLSVTMTNLSKATIPVKIDHVNKFPTVWGIYMNTEHFASNTMSTEASKVITIRLDGNLKLGTAVSGKIISVEDKNESSPIPSGCAVITVAHSNEKASLFDSVSVGDNVKFDISCAEGWESVITALGGGDIIVRNGEAVSGISDESHEKVSNPRTAVGIRENGEVVFFAVNGRGDDARGLKLDELASLMAELGCATAINLDGGGSTTVMTRPTMTNEIGYVTRPIDTNYRALANGILFVSRYVTDGVPSALALSPYAKYLLRGSSVDFSAKLLDSSYAPIGISVPSDRLTLEFAEQYPADIGKVSGGRFTAGYVAGEYFFNVKTTEDSNIDGETSIIVTDKLDGLELGSYEMKLLPGYLTEIDISAQYAGKEVICDSASFYYTLNDTHIVPRPEDYPEAAIVCDLGYLDKKGRFQAFGGVEGEVTLGVWFDQFVRYVKINISNKSDIIADFETPEEANNYVIVSDHAFPAEVKGYKSEGAMGIVYSYADAKGETVLSVKPKEEISLLKGTESIKISVQGEISGSPMAVISDENGNEYVISYSVTKDYTKPLGWRELTATIPQSLKATSLKLSSIFEVKASGNGAGSIAIDNPLIYYGDIPAPELAAIENHWAAANLYTLYDMTVIEDIDCELTDGARYYSPDIPLTRGEFAKLLVRFLGLDTESYVNEGLTLDAETPVDKIPYIRAAIANGLMSGRGVLEDGSVVFDPSATITREEAFKVFGALLSISEAAVSFSDSKDISSWAMTGIAKCVSAGLVKGYDDNTLRPRATISRAEMASLLIRMG